MLFRDKDLYFLQVNVTVRRYVVNPESKLENV